MSSYHALSSILQALQNQRTAPAEAQVRVYCTGSQHVSPTEERYALSWMVRQMRSGRYGIVINMGWPIVCVIHVHAKDGSLSDHVSPLD